ncbi:MAG: helix-turn-helix domain-containing protein [Alphaproteobacteria bacterium]
MARNPRWRPNWQGQQTEAFRDRLGRVFAVYPSVLVERPGAGYLARLQIKKLREAVRLHGSQRKAAEALGMSRDQLQRKLRKAA